MAKKTEIPQDALPKEQWWTVVFDGEPVRKEFREFNKDLKDAFWILHDTIKYKGLSVLGRNQKRKLRGTNDMWELRFRSGSGIGRGVYVVVKDRKVVVLAFFAKKTQKTPQQILDTAERRRKNLTMEETAMAIVMSEAATARQINAEDEFWHQYGGDPKGLAKYYEKRAAHFAKLSRAKRVKALPRKVKEALVQKLAAKRS